MFIIRVERRPLEWFERFDPDYAEEIQQYNVQRSYYFGVDCANVESVRFTWMDNSMCAGSNIPGFDGMHFFIQEVREVFELPNGLEILYPDYEFHNFLSHHGILSSDG